MKSPEAFQHIIDLLKWYIEEDGVVGSPEPVAIFGYSIEQIKKRLEIFEIIADKHMLIDCEDPERYCLYISLTKEEFEFMEELL